MSKDKERIEFSAIIGNPPYQVTKGGTKNVNVWQHFVKVANLCGAKWVSMIHPGRWVVPKEQMKSVRDEILDSGLNKFMLYPESNEIFDSVEIPGGITITNFKKDYKGKVDYFVRGEKQAKNYNKETKIMNNFEEEAFTKIFNDTNNYQNSMSSRVKGSVGSLNSSEFGYSREDQMKFIKDSSTGMKNPIKVWSNNGFGKGGGNKYDWYYIEKDKLNTIPSEIIASRKVMFSKVGKTTEGRKGGINGNIMLADKKAVGTNVFFVIPEKDDNYDLKLIQSMFCTKTVRFLMSITQKDQCVRGFENIPDYTYFMDDMKDPKYNNKMFEGKLGLLTDEYFYKKFNFSQELIDHIENKLGPKELA